MATRLRSFPSGKLIERLRANVYCHRPSNSANILKHALRLQGMRSRRIYGLKNPKREVPTINWGCSDLKINRPHILFNPPDKVALSISKQQSLRAMYEADLSCVRITNEKEMADDWVKRGYKVLRRRDGLSGGKGISLYHPEKNNGGGKFDFYSRVFPKTHEFRVHVVGDQVVDLVQKKATTGDEAEVDRLIRTHENGWIFAHDGIVLSDQKDVDTIGKMARDAVRALGLDFGAVDILATLSDGAARRLRKAVICEVNSSPGLENTRTIQAYAVGLKKLLLQRKGE